MMRRGDKCGKGAVKHFKMVASMNDSGTYFVPSPAIIIAVISGANSHMMAKNLKKANRRPNTSLLMIISLINTRHPPYYSVTLSDRFSIILQYTVNIC